MFDWTVLYIVWWKKKSNASLWHPAQVISFSSWWCQMCREVKFYQLPICSNVKDTEVTDNICDFGNVKCYWESHTIFRVFSAMNRTAMSWMAEVYFLASSRNFPLNHHIHNSSAANPVSYQLLNVYQRLFLGRRSG